MLEIRESVKGFGRGVFTTEKILKDQEFEVAPVVVIEAGTSKGNTLKDYVFEWEDDEAVALGFGSLYNHSFKPNAAYYCDNEERTITLYALRDIYPGEEIYINYNGDYKDSTPLWFDSK